MDPQPTAYKLIQMHFYCEGRLNINSLTPAHAKQSTVCSRLLPWQRLPSAQQPSQPCLYAPRISLCCKSNGVVTTPPSQAPFCQATQQQATASPKTYRVINDNPAHDQLPVTTFPAPLPTSKCTTAMPPQPVTLSDFIVFSPHGRAQLHTTAPSLPEARLVDFTSTNLHLDRSEWRKPIACAKYCPGNAT